ncbi:MAG: winged helix-turn-helix transcriptional regulator [Candidatus Freyarchaeota archaeon]|nr:winged helix-turn-helix transcriptional regulator [Candidatus Jordarchaeia archaeon]MBS7268910.1 winged helix-turn-helix transcriptional regulator [Candidatus Jordarchaeia archaeon]MBS7279630.1 winged helix-turn-helix transcriptional regulator [Candidatus Jordarchaeia archaeon]
MEVRDLIMKRNVEFLKALADETRLKILQFLGDNEMCQCDIIPAMDKSQSTISQHLQILTNAGVLEYRKEGQRSVYKLKDERIRKIMELVNSISRDSLLEISKLAKSIGK